MMKRLLAGLALAAALAFPASAEIWFTSSSTGAGGGLTVGTSTITGGTTTGVLYDNAGVLGEYTVSGSGSVCMTTSCVMVTPTLGVATGTSLALGGATIGANALAVTGTASVSGSITSTAGNLSALNVVATANPNAIIAARSNTSRITLGLSDDVILTRGGAAATLQHGSADAASPVAQIIKFQDVVAGTSNTAGVNATYQAPAGTGTGAGGSLIWQVAPAGSSGSAKNAWATALTIDSTKLATFAGPIAVNGGASVSALTSGTWTPTLTNTLNVDASTAYLCQYMRVGATVTGSCRIDIDATAGATATAVDFTPPVAFNFGGLFDAAGTCNAIDGVSLSAGVLSESTGDILRVQYVNTADTANRAFYCSFTYRVI